MVALTDRIGWPSGIVQEFQPVPARQFLTVVKPTSQWADPRMTEDGFQAEWIGRRGANCRLEVSTNLVNWTPLTTVQIAEPSARVTEPKTAGTKPRFHRAAGPR
jgi:hypothetical protein